MAAAMRHRGPDDAGTETMSARGHVCRLASTRLAIIDLSPAGHMPMADPASGSRIVYNGEAYNFAELRRELESRGERFVSRTDTEVVLRLHRLEGARCVERLRGMFAFAVWDAERAELFLARDRAGKKPLYYHAGPGGTFVFASEVRTILASGLVEPRLDPGAVEAYLANGYVLAPATIVRGVRALLPGHVMRVGADGRVLETTCYWRPPRASAARRARVEDAVASLRATFRQAVAMRLVSDVPLSVFLSGGLDSSALLGALGRDAGDVRTFSIAFDEAAYDESEHSRRVAAYWGSRHTEIRLSRERFFRWLPDALASMDQPTFDGVNTYCVARAAKEAGTTVALSGLGSDELFGGYPFFKAVPLLGALAPAAGAAARPFGPAARGLLGGRRAASRVSYAWKMLDLAGAPLGPRPGSVHPVLAAYQVSQILFPSWSRRALMPAAPAGVNGSAAARFGVGREFADFLREDLEGLDATSALSMVTWRMFLGERCLKDTDAMSMGVSLEVRAPFTDHRFVEEAMRLPGRIRCAGPPDKSFAQRLLAPCLEGAWAPRPKQGFVMPFREWLASAEGREAVGAALRDRARLEAAGLDPAAVAALWEAHAAAPAEVPWSRVWAVYALAEWCRRQGASL
jgi:asparagine synthase (glutamine-hydrolysing)